MDKVLQLRVSKGHDNLHTREFERTGCSLTSKKKRYEHKRG